MKTYTVSLVFKKKEFAPFRSFIYYLKSKRQFYRAKKKAIKLFKSLKWTESQVLEMTLHCYSLDDAISTLANNILEQIELDIYYYPGNKVLPYLKVMISKRFSEKWK